MRAVARITLFYIFAFIFFLLAGTGVSVMREWMEATQALPPMPFPLTRAFFRALSSNVPLAVYASALLVLPSAVQRGYGNFATGISVLVLTSAALFSVTFGVLRLSDAIDASVTTISVKELGSAGLMVELETSSIAFSGDPIGKKTEGSAVEIKSDEKLRVIPGKNAAALIQRTKRLSPFYSTSVLHPTLVALSQDFEDCAGRLAAAYKGGWLALLAYSCALALLLSSFSPLAGVTRWPLADLAICALAFRAILIFEGIASSGPVVRFVLNGGFGVPEIFVAPALIGACGLTFAIGGSILRIARGGSGKHG